MCIKNSESSLLISLKYFSLSLLLIFTLTFSVFSNSTFAQDAPAGDEGPTGGGQQTTTQPSQGDAGASASTGGVPSDDAAIARGKELFNNNCTSCHQVSDQVVVGPGLKDVDKRRPLPWLVAFIKNSQKVIQSGDKYAVDLYSKFNKTVMPPHDFSDADITAIVAYIAKESASPAGNTANVPGDATGDTGGVAAKEQGPGSLVTVLLIAFIAILLLILIVLIIIVTVLAKYLKQKGNLSEEDKELVEQKFDFNALIKNRAFLGILTFVFVAIVAKALLDGAYNLGIQQGYAPTQPIAFSHKLHAGQYKIDCSYCHTGVRKSMSANIPSANICMNCHNTIKPESPEIKKIYAAIEKDEPIEWVRIHNLPDLAYFNHSQHVKVAGLECQNCHGPIQDMEVVQQFSPLTMGWCINCHRQTEINGADNGYYDELLNAHNKAVGGKTPMTVEHIGGLECSKCHY
jgi:mono/diheme cytochrome c family protein